MSYSKHRLNEVVALQKAVLGRIEADLGEFGSSPRRKYIQEFTDEFQTYQAACDWSELAAEASRANVVWIGDYHPLGRSRAFASDVLRDVAVRKESNVALAVEMVFARQQKVLDRWMQGRISERDFLEQIRYFEEWGCDWPSYKALFDVARELGIPVYAIDCHPRRDMRSIGRRDQAVARRVAQLLDKDPSRTIVAVFGESHLASTHLPRRVNHLVERSGMPIRDVVLLQNLDSLYWTLQGEGREGVRTVRIKSHRYCVFNATPMEKYESFRQYLVNCAEGDDTGSDWTRFVHTVIDSILDFLEIEKDSALMDSLPKVYSEITTARLPGFLVRQDIPPSQVRLALESLQNYGTSYIPELNSMFIEDFRLDYTTEETARFIHHWCRGELQCSTERPASDVFFVTILERALGYFFSKLLDSSRDGIESLSEQVLQHIGYNEELARTVTCLLDPDRRPSTQHFKRLRTTVEQSASRSRMLHLLAQVLGYALGRRLHRAYLESRISRKEIQAILRDPLEAPHGPLECYVELSTRLS